MTRFQTCAACLSVAALLGGCGQSSAPSAAASAEAACPSTPYKYAENIGGPIELVNEAGETVTEDAFKGAPSLIYFGFTYCPDICPGTLVALKNAYSRLPDDMARPQTLLISIDPERDTPDRLAAYTANDAFPETLSGLTGSQAQVEAAADVFAAGFSRVETPESLNDYTMDHTSILYLMDADWKLVTFFAEGASNPERIANCIEAAFSSEDAAS